MLIKFLDLERGHLLFEAGRGGLLNIWTLREGTYYSRLVVGAY